MNIYLDMVHLYAVHQNEHLQLHIILQPDGAPPHWCLPGPEISGKMDQQRRPTRFVSSFSRLNTNGLLHVSLSQQHCLPVTFSGI